MTEAPTSPPVTDLPTKTEPDEEGPIQEHAPRVDEIEVSASKAQVKHAPTIELTNDELSQADESALYHYYQLNYVPSDTPSSRRLARR